METPQERIVDPEGPDSIVDLSTPEGEVNTADPEPEGDARGKGERREEPARTEPEIIAGDDDEEDPDEPRRRGETREDYSRRVQGRINREIALRRRVERRLDEQTIANEDLRQRLARVERRQAEQSSTAVTQKSIADITSKIDAKKTQLHAAIEAGDTAKQLEINIELSELIADRKILEQRLKDQAEQSRQQAASGSGEGSGEGDEPLSADERRIARATARWQQQNRKWWNLNRFREVRDDAVEIDKELRKEVANGLLDMEEYSDEYFAELSTRLKKNYPELDVRGLDGEVIEEATDDVETRTTSRQTQQRARPAGGSMGTRDRRRDNDNERALAQQGRVRLTNVDYGKMRKFGLDPNNPEHKKRFAKERMRTILSEGSAPSGGGR